MRKTFTFAREEQPGVDWLGRFRAGWDEAWRWYLGEGRAAAPTAIGCRDALLAPPLYSGDAASPTVYWPVRGEVEYIWRGKRCRQAFDHFTPGDYAHDYGELASGCTG